MNKLNVTQVENLIKLIKENPFIFDRNNPNYKHATKKDEIWQDISEKIGAEENECKTAWKSLRTQFVKACNEKPKWKGGRKVAGNKNYKYYHQLLFLKDSISTRKKRLPKTEKSDEKYDVLLYDEDTDFNERKGDIFVENIKLPIVSKNSTPRSTPSPRPSKKIKTDFDRDHHNNKEYLKECFDALVTEIRSVKETKPQDDIQTYFVVLGNMVRSANLTTFQSRQIQKKIFNFVTDELDKLELEQTEDANK